MAPMAGPEENWSEDRKSVPTGSFRFQVYRDGPSSSATVISREAPRRPGAAGPGRRRNRLHRRNATRTRVARACLMYRPAPLAGHSACAMWMCRCECTLLLPSASSLPPQTTFHATFHHANRYKAPPQNETCCGQTQVTDDKAQQGSCPFTSLSRAPGCK